MLFLAFAVWLCTAPLAILLLREILSPGLTVNLALAYLGLLILGCLILCRRSRHDCGG